MNTKTINNKGTKIMTKKQKIINEILNNLPLYNTDDVLKVELIKGKPITLEHYTKILEPINKNEFNYFNNRLSCIRYDTQLYSNWLASERLKRILTDIKKIKNISLSRLKSCLYQLLNFKSEITHYPRLNKIINN